MDHHPTGPASLPVTGRYTRQALVIAAESAQPQLRQLLHKLDFTCETFEDPYTAMLELLGRPMVFRAVVISLQGLYREELAMVRTLRTRMPRLDVFLTHIEGRESSLAEAMKLGATGIIAHDGLHRLVDIEQINAADSTLPSASSASFAQPKSAVTRDVGLRPSAKPAPSAPVPAAARLNDDYDLPRETFVSKKPAPAVAASLNDESARPEPAMALAGLADSPEPVLSADEIRALLADQD